MVDWTKPIEAVHEDGRVVAVKLATGIPDTYGDYRTTDAPAGDANNWWHGDGASCCNKKWKVRNVQPAAAKPAISDELVERMVEYIRYDVKNWPNGAQCEKGKALLAELPQPIDPAIAEARKLAAEFLLHGHGTEGVLDGALDDTPLLKTLVKAFKAGEAQ